jgi:hypothetical protein
LKKSSGGFSFIDIPYNIPKYFIFKYFNEYKIKY